MKDKLTLDWKEYYLVPVEELEPVEEDKYKKIRERVKRDDNELHILWENKVIISYSDGGITLIDKEYISKDELHFQECTLWDLKENDVVWFEERAYIIIEIDDSIINTYYFKNDIIHTRELATDWCLFIKILRH